MSLDGVLQQTGIQIIAKQYILYKAYCFITYYLSIICKAPYLPCCIPRQSQGDAVAVKVDADYGDFDMLVQFEDL